MPRTAVALFAFLGVSVTANQSAQVRVSIATGAWVSAGTAVLDVVVDIPPGHFIPAETQGTLRGVALLPARHSATSRSLATFPATGSVRLPGADAPVLAYSGRTTIQLPIEMFPITVAATRLSRFPVTQDVSVEFWYQLCDSRACEPVTSQTVDGKIVSMPRAAIAQSIAFRFGESHVAVVLPERFIPDQPAWEEESVRLGFVMPLRRLPADHSALSQFTGNLANGASWAITSTRGDFVGTVERPTAFNGDCGAPMPLGVVLSVADAGFARERMKFYLAKPGRATQDIARVHPVATNLRLTDADRRALEDVLNKQMRMTLPSALAPDPEISNPTQQPKESPYHTRIRNGEGQLVYHVEAFRVAPDADPRLFVRAYWALHGVARTGLILWIRFDGSRFVVERTDAHVSRYAGLDTFFGSAPAARPDLGGMLLNVIPAEDGWAYILMGDAVYEAAGITVWKYSPFGPVSMGLEYVHGC